MWRGTTIRRRTRAEIAQENRNAVIGTIAIVVVLFSVFFVAPGMMLVTFAVRPFIHLDRGQMWLFSAVASAATYGGLRIGLGPERSTGKYYVVACTLAVGAFVLAKFGFHAVWPDRMFDFFARADVP